MVSIKKMISIVKNTQLTKTPVTLPVYIKKKNITLQYQA